MNGLFDVLLPRPIPGFLYHTLVFFFFTVHFFFVLLALGTAFFGILAVIRRRRAHAARSAEAERTGGPSGPSPANGPTPGRSAGIGVLLGLTILVMDLFRRAKETAQEGAGAGAEEGKRAAPPTTGTPVYFASKSLMITFGIAALLFVLAFHSVPFTGAANLNGGWWIGIVVVLSAALILLEVFDQKTKDRTTSQGGLLPGLLGLGLLATVPAIFVAFVVTAENPSLWDRIFRGGVVFSPLALHWAVRLAHVFGAAVVVTGLFFLALPVKAESRRPAVSPRILFGALMLQILIGVVLYMTLPQPKSFTANMFVVIGAGGSLLSAWFLFTGRQRPGGGRFLPAAILAVILIPMLLARQVLQDNVFAPFTALLLRNARAYVSEIRGAAPPGGENRFLEEQHFAYNLPQFIYQKSCAFCHGAVGNGAGTEAGALKIPPADLTQARTRRQDLIALLRKGIPGSGMPYFSIYTGSTLKDLAGYLYGDVGMRPAPEPVTAPVSPADAQEAARVFARECAACHGSDGSVGPEGRKLRPAPRDMNRWARSPSASFRVITEGYRGTAMKGYGHLPEAVRWGLVRLVNGFYDRQGKKE